MVGRKVEGSKYKYVSSLFATNLWIAFLAGTVLVLISYYVFPIDNALPNGNIESAAWWQILHSAAHEAGFALIVAGIIWMMFEFFAQKESKDQWDGVVETISQNVFAAMLKRELPEKLISQAFDLILNQQFIRTEVSFTFRISGAKFSSRDGQQRNYVRLNVIVRSKTKNVTNGTAKLLLGMALPNPMLDELKALCSVKRISVKTDGCWKDCDLHEAERKFRELIQDDARKEVLFDAGELSFDPKEEKETLIEYVLAKEDEDNEVVQMRYPVESLLITIVDNDGGARVVRAKAIHPDDLEEITISDQEGPYTYKLDRFLLPHQGFVVWWKNLPRTDSDQGPPEKTT